MSLSARCGSLLYMDTDSIMYDNARVNDTYYTFIISEEIGDYNMDKCTYDTTWKCKEDNMKSIVVIAKKSYFLFKSLTSSSPEVVKLKGIYSSLMAKFSTRDVIKRVLHGLPEQQSLSTLARQTVMDNDMTFNYSALSNRLVLPSNFIYSANIQKTLTKAKDYFQIHYTNEQESNLANLLFSAYSSPTCPENLGVKNFLIFCCSRFGDSIIPKYQDFQDISVHDVETATCGYEDDTFDTMRDVSLYV